MSENSESSLAPAVTRAVRILSLLAEARGVPVPLTEIARQIEAAKSSTSNICVVLEEAGLVQRRETGYVLGRRTVELGGAYLASFNQIREFYRVCAESPVLSHELVQIAVLEGTDVVYLARHEGRAPLRLTAGVGDRFPAALTAVGNALLATLPDDEVRERYRSASFPQLTERSTQSVDGLLAKLRATRERGYSIDEGEVFPSVVAMAVAVPARLSGEKVLALGVSTLDSPIQPELSAPRRQDVLAALRDAAEHLSNPMAPPLPAVG
ncbi:IclR family transcriptional regulator [Xylanimonas ulmi]|uniref:IclR family transcriptional regulator n=1 Tax=Xylanimonas ulmi TaxID=228973 RepID=A0A4V2EYC5_9MICO|nr:IclR family transcriptional regulator [Xylanibacterium ulmi]